MKRWIAAFLTIVFVAGLWIDQPVYAALEDFPVQQAPVSDLTITSADTATGSSSYRVTLSWSQPGYYSNDMTALNQNTTPTPPATAPLYAEGYEIFFRNATKNQAFPETPSDSIKVTQTDTSISRSYNYTLDAGSLYAFRVVPYHYNWYRRTVNGQQSIVQERAPMDTLTAPQERQAVYLTDLVVTAKGSGNTMTVNWSNPTWGGVNVFNGYRISYQLDDNSHTYIEDTQSRVVALSDPGLTVAQDGTLQYTFTDNDLLIGRFYAVKVEPLIDGVRVRPKGGASSGYGNRIVIGGTEYYFAYRDERIYEYRTNNAYVSPSLNAVAEGSEYVRVYWSNLTSLPNINNLERLEIWESADSNMTVQKQIGTYYNQSAMLLTHWLAEKPSSPMYYQIALYFVGTTAPMKSETAYFDPAYNEFSPYKPNVLALEIESNTLDLTWLAFLRQPYNDDEAKFTNSTYNNLYVDRNVRYDIYVSDSMENLNDPMMIPNPVISLSANNLTLQGWMPPGQANASPAYNTRLTGYVGRNEAGALVRMPLDKNKVYYVKIVAVRDPSGQQSQPAYGAVFMPPDEPIWTNPLMIEAPPLKVVNTTTTDITISFDEKFVEIYDSASDRWYSQVGVTKGGALVFGKDAMGLDSGQVWILNDIFDPNLYDYNETIAKSYITQTVGAALANPAVLDTMPVRLIDLTGASYEIHTVAYDTLVAAGGYDAYRESYLSDGTTNRWQAFNPSVGTKPGSRMHVVTVCNAYGTPDRPSSGALISNSSYVIYVRPYATVEGQKMTAYYPNYVMVTTAAVHPPFEIIPTVPLLEAVDATSLTLTIRWAYTENLEYDLAYTERLSTYPEGGTVVPWNTIKETAYVKEENGKTWMYYTLYNMFPDTQYYLWMRSRAINETGTVNSAWSNPIDMHTLDIETPIPPRGLSPAAKDHMNTYNQLNGTNFAASEENALTVEWMRDANDLANAAATGSPGQSSGSTNISGQLLRLTDVANMYITRYSGLIANRSYYLRAKTVLTVTRSGVGGAVTTTYNYVVQISLDPAFTDYFEFCVPPYNATTPLNATNAKRKESEWSSVIRLMTGRTDEEYDGNVNPDYYPLPEQDWEIKYDGATQTLTYRFRAGQTDASGAKDQNVDQRFISRLISERVYTYALDLTSYGNYKISKRVAELPYSIIEALAERKISLTVTAGNVRVTYPPAFFAAIVSGAANGAKLGANDSVRLTFDTAPGGVPTLDAKDRYVSAPQKLTAQTVAGSRTVAVEHFASPLRVDLKLDSRVTSQEQNVGVYTAVNATTWERVNATYQSEANEMRYDAYKPGLYTAIAKTAPTQPMTNDVSRDAYYNVTARIDITDMTSYSPTMRVTANQFNNLVAAAAMNRSAVAINAALSAADRQALSKAGMLAPDGAMVTREVGIPLLVKLYELKAARIITPSETVDTTPYIDIGNASAQSQGSLLKAAEIGFLEAGIGIANMARPGMDMTIGELIQMLDIVLMEMP